MVLQQTLTWKDCVLSCDEHIEDKPLALDPLLGRKDAFNAAAHLAANLTDNVIKRAAVWCDDAALMTYALLACHFAGIQAVLPGSKTAAAIADAEQHADIWLTDSDDIAAHLPHWRANELMRLFLEKHNHGTAAAAYAHAVFQPDARILLKTSGSSGDAKWVVKTWEQMLLEAHALSGCLKTHWTRFADGHHHSPDAVIGSVSPQHLYGLTFRIMLPLIAAWPILRRQCVYPELLLEYAAHYPNNIAVVSPTLLNALLNNNSDKNLLVHTQFICGGGVLPVDAAKNIMDLGLPAATEIYGSTETGVIAARQYPNTWQFLPDVHAQTDDTGILSVRSPWCQDSQITGDVIQHHDNGFQIMGRHDRLIKIADKRYSLAQVEQALIADEWIADAVCAQHPQKNRLGAWVALNAAGIQAYRQSGRRALVAHLKNRLLQQIDAPACPRYWRFETALPRNQQGKILARDVAMLWQKRPIQAQWLPEKSQSENEWFFQAAIPLDLAYFSGHFDTFPLVPGVVELQWVMDLVKILPLPQEPVLRVENLKFQHFLRPADAATIHLTWQTDKHKLLFQISTPDAVCAGGRIVFQTKEGAAA
ncbi:AMP-binding protein [Stenoxybacter acetivorans]|uniref:AMP-binding protein n=1 Tax=Stenoxybacter acetivorans TaxID=422441 RepID=UPI000689D657|nr:AMP-binding protein [Stenoxybacter acetivorans]